MKKILLIVTLAVCAIAPLRAENLTLTNRQIDQVCGALMKLGVGLNGSNAVKATRDLSMLRPLAEAYAAGIQAETANRKIVATTRTDSPEYAAFVAAVETFADTKVKVDLQLFKISDEELERVATTTAPVHLDTIIHFLDPKK